MTSGSALTRKPALSLSCVFGLGHFPKSKIDFESSFLIKSYTVTVVKKNCGAFGSIFKEVKNGFTIVNPKYDFARARASFHKNKKNYEKTNVLRISPIIRFGGLGSQIFIRSIITPPNSILIKPNSGPT